MADLVADIGGTNARFALVEPDPESGPAPGEPVALPCADFAGIAEACAAAIARLGAAPRRAALAVAGPVAVPGAGDRVTMTNLDWSFSIRKLCRGLGLERLLVVNDFQAIAWSLPALGGGDVEPIGPALAAVEGAACAVLGPGTGLGQSGLIPGPDGAAAIAGEGGHVDFAPQDDDQAEIRGLLLGRRDHVALEDILSGPGLVALYKALGALRGLDAPLDDPAAIAAAGAAEPAGEACAMFARILGQAAGNLALILGAQGGVYIAGGVVPALGARFDHAAFRQGFEAKGRFAPYLRPIPTWLIRHPTPALIGLARLLHGAGDKR